MMRGQEIGSPVHLARLEARKIVRDAFPRELVFAADKTLWPRHEGGQGACPHDLYNESGDECAKCHLCYHRRIMRENVGQTSELQWCEWCGEEKYPFRRRGGDPNDIDYEPYAYDGF